MSADTNQTRKATKIAMVVDTTEKQLLQSEALFHLPVHRIEHTRTQRFTRLDGRYV